MLQDAFMERKKDAVGVHIKFNIIEMARALFRNLGTRIKRPWKMMLEKEF